MAVAFHYQETDSFTYFLSSVAFLDYKDVEEARSKLSAIYNEFLLANNLVVGTDDYSTAQICLNEESNLFVLLSDIDPYMRVESIEDYINGLKFTTVDVPPHDN